MRSVNAALFFVFVIFLAACGGGGGGEVQSGKSPNVKSIEVEKIQSTYIENTTNEISVSGILDSGGTVTVGGITWSSSDTSIAYVNDENYLVAVSPGVATVTAMLEGKEDFFTVTITPKVQTSMQLRSESVSPPLGQNFQIEVLGLFNNGSTSIIEDATWESSDLTIATVNDGMVSTYRTGQVKITAEKNGFVASISVNVTEAALSSISISVQHTLQPLGYDQIVLANGVFTDGTTTELSDLNWFNSNTEVMSLDENSGVLTAISAGFSMISASTRDGSIVSSPVRVEVTAAELKGIRIVPESLSLPLGLEGSLTALGLFDGGFSFPVDGCSYSSSDPLILSISNEESYTSHALGSVIIQCIRGAFWDEIALTVTEPLVRGLSIEPSIVSSIPLGLNQKYTATATYTDNNQVDVTDSAIWSISDSELAELSYPSPGEVELTAKALGSVRIESTYMDVMATKVISVTDPVAVSMNFFLPGGSKPNPVSIPKGLEQDLRVAIGMSDGSIVEPDSGLVWEVSSSAILGLNSNGGRISTIQALQEGNSSVIARYGELSLEIPVMVTEALPVSVSEPSREVHLDDNVRLGATLLMTDGSMQPLQSSLSWTSDDENIASVSNIPGDEGQLTLRSEGTVRLTYTDNLSGLSGEMEITIIQPRLVTGFESINPTNSTNYIGEGEYEIAIQFSGRNESSVYFYNDLNDGVGTTGLSNIADVNDASAYDYSLRSVHPMENSAQNTVVVRKIVGETTYYGVVQVHEVRHAGRDGDIDSVTYSWAIRTDGGADFGKFAPEKEIVLMQCLSPNPFDVGGCEEVSMPYVLLASSERISLPVPAEFTLGQYSLIALSEDKQITGLSAIDTDGAITPWFEGLENNDVISVGHSASFALQTPPTGNATRNLIYSFSVNDSLNETFSASVSFKSN